MLILVACSNHKIFAKIKVQIREVFVLFNENIKALRKSKGLSQEELAVKLNVVRQTVSKWEKGLSVPNSEMLVTISEVLEIPVSTILSETIAENREDELRVISEKLEIINLQLLKKNEERRKLILWILVSVCVFIVLLYLLLYFLGSSYLEWDYTKPDLAVAGTILHGIEWIFVRLAPFGLVGTLIGIILTQKKL